MGDNFVRVSRKFLNQFYNNKISSCDRVVPISNPNLDMNKNRVQKDWVQKKFLIQKFIFKKVLGSKIILSQNFLDPDKFCVLKKFWSKRNFE